MKKIKVEIISSWVEVEQDKNALNQVDKWHANFEVTRGKKVYEGNFVAPKRINDIVYSDKYLFLNLLLSIVDEYSYYKEYEGFKTCYEVVDFSTMFGLDINKAIEATNNIKKLGKVVKKTLSKMSWEELDHLREVYSDGNTKKVYGAEKKLRKYFEFKKKDFKGVKTNEVEN